MCIADPRVGVLFDGWNLLATPRRAPGKGGWRVDLVIRRDVVDPDLGLRSLEDGVSPVLHFPATTRLELRADVLLEGSNPTSMVVGTLADGRVLRATFRVVE